MISVIRDFLDLDSKAMVVGCAIVVVSQLIALWPRQPYLPVKRTAHVHHSFRDFPVKNARLASNEKYLEEM